MDDLRERMESDLDVHGCSAERVESDLGVILHGWHKDALGEWVKSDLDGIMVGTWMNCGNGWSLIWALSWLAHGYHGWQMDALRERMESARDVIMVGSWMLGMTGGGLSGRYHDWPVDALREWMESDLDVIMVGLWLSWLAHGCSA